MKRLIIILLLILVMSIGGWVAYRALTLNEPLNPAIATFYPVDEQAYANDNGYIAMLGIHAPVNIDDTYAWALKLVNDHIKLRQDYLTRQASGVPASQLGAPPEFSERWNAIKEKITPQGDITATNCWLTKGWKLPKADIALACNNTQELVDLIDANHTLLSRYHAQFTYNRFIDLPQLGIAIGSQMIQENALFLGYLVTASPTRPDEALQEWMDNAKFLKRALADQNSLITRSVLMVMYVQTQRVLPTLLGADATLVTKYEKPLLEILVPFGPKEMNIPVTVKMDYQALGSAIRNLGTHNQNKFYQFGQDQIALALTPPRQFAQAQAKFMEKYGHPQLPAGMTREEFVKLDEKEAMEKLQPDTITDLIIGGLAIGGDLFKAMQLQDARNRMLNLYVQMRARAITPEQIPAFLKSSPASLFDPLTEQPFTYDASTKLLYSTPEGEDSRQGLVLNW